MAQVNPTCEPTAWGYVVADARYPKVWDANHAAVLRPTPESTAAEIRAALTPVLRRAGAGQEHIEMWGLPEQSGLRDEFRVEVVGALPVDAVMVFEADPDRLAAHVEGIRLRELTDPGDAFLAWYRRSRSEFGEPLAEDVLDQLLHRDLEVFLPRGMRWFAATAEDEPVGYTSVLSLAGVGYLDGVMTMPTFRGRGIATATIAAAIRASRSAGDEVVHLLAEDGGAPQRLYERLGFRTRARVETFSRPLDD
jgi:ribosomal protein S18 acetylase RimI-like enzyme